MAVVLVIQKLTNFAQNLMDMAKSKKPNTNKAAKAPAKSAKKVAKPALKAKVTPKAKPKAAAKPAAKKAVKKAAPKKAAAKPAPKKTAKPVAKKAVKSVAPKKAAKPAPKKVIKKEAPKKVVKPVAKKAAKPAPKVAPKKVVAPAKPVAKPAPAPKAKAPAPKAKPEVVKAAPKVEAKPAVAAAPVVKPIQKKPLKKGAKPTEMYEGKRLVRAEMPAKALITLQKPEEDEIMDAPHYEFPTLRYSDAELKEFKDIIDKKLTAAREELVNLKDSLESHTESQVGNKSWNMEEGSDTSEMEYLMNQIARLNKFIRDLEMALVRIENKTYGICRATGKLIDKNRLRVVPHATLSMEAKMSRKSDDVTNTSQAPAAHMGSEGEGFGGEE
jgi:RNA polymerase-binding transcription factor DksA